MVSMVREEIALYAKQKRWLTYLCLTGGSPIKNDPKMPQKALFDHFLHDQKPLKTFKFSEIPILSMFHKNSQKVHMFHTDW